MNRPPSLLMVAGEVSGDILGAGLLEAIRRHHPGVRCFGIGGDHLRQAGMEILQDAASMAAMGFSEVIGRLFFFRRVFLQLVATARARRPDAVILIDYPGFNIRFAARARALGIPVIYYVCPQVWAWHRSRLRSMAASVDRLICVFPFEPMMLADSGLRVDYVGHPLVRQAMAARSAPPAPLPWRGKPRVAILPGSRRSEIDRVLPALVEAARRVAARFPEAAFLVASPSEAVAGIVRQALAGRPAPPMEIVAGQTREVLRQADAAWVASGTATLEAALMRCPMVITYRTSWITYQLARHIVRVPHIGMANLVAGRRICPELIQDEATPDALAQAIMPLLTDSPERRRMLADIEEAVGALGPPGAEDRAARIVIETLAGDAPPPQAQGHGSLGRSG